MQGAKTIYYCSTSSSGNSAGRSNGHGQPQPQPKSQSQHEPQSQSYSWSSTREGSASDSDSASSSSGSVSHSATFAAGDCDGDGVSLAKQSSRSTSASSGRGSLIYYTSPNPNPSANSADLVKQKQQQSAVQPREVNNNVCINGNGQPESGFIDHWDREQDSVTSAAAASHVQVQPTQSQRASSASIAISHNNTLQMETEVEVGNGHNNNDMAKIDEHAPAKNTAQSQSGGHPNGNGGGKHDKDTSSPPSSLQPLEFAHPLHDAPAKCNLVDSIRTLFVDVIVSNAVSPLNFSIQSYKEYGKLKLLEAHMTNWYTSQSGSNEPLHFENLTLNGFYAVKYTPPPSAGSGNGNGNVKRVHADGKSLATESDVQWRRCQIIKPFSQSLPILTNLVDHGCYFMTEPKNIQPLRKMYTELPCQSLEAKLHFVDTKKIQFTPEDCHRFHKQVEGKPFCSIIMKPLQPSATEPLKGDAKVSVVLIDTSTEKDHYIHHDYIVPKKKL